MGTFSTPGYEQNQSKATPQTPQVFNFDSRISWLTQSNSRSGKSTHSSMISNSVTYLRSYTNTAITIIAENYALISPVTPRDRWRRRAKHRRLRIKRRCLCIECRYRRIEWQVFHDVSQCFKSVSSCFTSGSWCLTSGSRCFTMHYNVLHVFHDVLLCLTMFYDV